MIPTTTYRVWAALWRSHNRLDGERQSLLIGPIYNPCLFRTRAACRAAIEKEYGYIRTRPDLQREPHGWRMPVPVRVAVIVRPLQVGDDQVGRK